MNLLQPVLKNLIQEVLQTHSADPVVHKYIEAGFYTGARVAVSYIENAAKRSPELGGLMIKQLNFELANFIAAKRKQVERN